MRGYPVDLTPDDNGTMLVTCPDLPEVTSFGVDEADALARARHAIEEALASRINSAESLPLPGPAHGRPIASLSAPFAAKLELHLALRAAGLPLLELARRLNRPSSDVERLLKVNYPSALDDLEAAFLALGKQLAIDVRDAA